MIPYEDWKIVYDDSEIDARIDPQEMEGYGMRIKKIDEFILFPRGTLKELAKSDREGGKRILENLIPLTLNEQILKTANLTKDSIIAVATKVYLIEEERFQQFLSSKRG